MSKKVKEDGPWLQLGPNDFVRASDFNCHILCLGISGAGKSSGSGAAIRRALLRAGVAEGQPSGGIVGIVKADETETWIREARENGRENSLIVFRDDGVHGFNFLDAEFARRGAGAVGSAVDYIMCICEAARDHVASSGSQDFFDDAKKQLLRKTLPILYAATGTIRLADVARFIQSAPTSLDEMKDEAWQASSFWFAMMALARKKPVVPLDPDQFNQIGRYWKDEYARLDGKTRGNIAISLTTVLDRFVSGPLARAFCGKTTFTMESTWHGAIVICDFPCLTMNEDGIIANRLIKLAYQRSILTRASQAPEHRQNLSFCYADECQAVLAPEDADYLATARSANACVVYLTQSISAFYNKIGGQNPKHATDMLVGNFQTKVFHTLDAETAHWAAETIGKGIQLRGNYSRGETEGTSFGMNMGTSTNVGTSTSVSSSSDGKGGGSSSMSVGTSAGSSESDGRNRGANYGTSYSSGQTEQIDYDLQPSFFSRHLKTGGPANGNEVTAIWFQAGRVFNATGTNYLHVRFQQ